MCALGKSHQAPAPGSHHQNDERGLLTQGGQVPVLHFSPKAPESESLAASFIGASFSGSKRSIGHARYVRESRTEAVYCNPHVWGSWQANLKAILKTCG